MSFCLAGLLVRYAENSRAFRFFFYVFRERLLNFTHMANYNLFYLLNSGKNPKFLYYGINYLRLITPKFPFRLFLDREILRVEKLADREYIMERVDYYNRFHKSLLPSVAEKMEVVLIPLKDQKMCRSKVYYFDSFEYTRWFSQDLKWNLCPGDVIFVPDVPSIVKSRPLIPNNENSVIMKLEKVRHFIFVKDRKTFSEKKNMVIFRGKIGSPGTEMFKENRYRFLERYWGHPMCDLGEIESRHSNPDWIMGKMTISEHLDYKFILSLEGNDVASNLKWVMSSNSLAVMPRPTCETWFMEGVLIPDYHYVEIKPDFSDLEERLTYFMEHPEEAQAIINHAHEYVEQFKNAKRERLISLLVLKKYFEGTNQL